MRRKSRWPAFDPNAEKIKFRSPKEFKEALTRESIQSQKEIHLVRNTETQTRARCVRKSCPWHIYATLDKANKVYQIKTLVHEHMLWNGDDGFEVEYRGDTYVVDLKK